MKSQTYETFHEKKSQNYDMQINDLVSQHGLSHHLEFLSHNYDSHSMSYDVFCHKKSQFSHLCLFLSFTGDLTRNSTFIGLNMI